jgi:hypothetical protein
VSTAKKSPAQKTYSGQDIADRLEVEGITLRRYIRSDGTRVGRGRKYSFTEEDAKAIAIGFLLQGTKEADKEEAEAEITEEVEALFATEESEVEEEDIDDGTEEEEADTDEEETEENDTEDSED